VKSKTLSLIIVVLVALVLSFIHCPLFDLFNEDKEIFRYAGMAIAKGQVPYRDFFDHKPPLIFFLNYWGYISGTWGFWLLDAFMVTGISVSFYRLCSNNQLAFPWLLPCLFNLLLRHHLVSNGTGMTREYTTIWTVLFFCMMLGRNRRRFIGMGVLCGLIFFMQQDAVLILLPFLFYALLDGLGKDVRQLFLRGLQLFIGFSLIALPITGYFAANHALGDFWHFAFATNFNVYTERKPLADHLLFMTGQLQYTGFSLVFYGSLLLSLVLFYFNNHKGLLLSAIAATILCFVDQYLSGRHITYYLLPLAGILPVLLFVVLAYSNTIPVQARRIGSFVYIGCIALIMGLTQYRTHLAQGTHVWISDTPEYRYLEQQQLKDYQLFVFCSSRFLYLNNQFRVLAPTRWIYHHFWYWFENWDRYNDLLHEIQRDLLRHHTTYVLDFSDNPKFKSTNHYNDWKAFLNAYYVPLTSYSEQSKCILWQLKQGTSNQQLNR